MLSKRFRLDGKSSIKLNELQIKIRGQIEREVEQGIYSFEKVPCCICGKSDLETLSEKDRFGLYTPVVICRNCGLVRTNPRMTQENYNHFYKTEYKELYAGKSIPSDEYFNSQYERRGRAIYSYIAKSLGTDLTNLKILELGCSAGGILQYFKQKGNQVCGCDLNLEYVMFGRDKYNLNLEVGTIDSMTISWTPDIVIYSHTLEHILNPVEELIKIRSIMSDKTLLYIEVPGFKHQWDLLRYFQNAHVYYFTLTTLKNLLKKAGYNFVCGDEFFHIHSIFQKSQTDTDRDMETESAYTESMRFLRRRERLYSLYRPYEIGENTLRTVLTPLLRKIGLYEFAGKIYRWIKG